MGNINQNNSGFNSMVSDSTPNANQSTKEKMISKLDFLLEKYQDIDFNNELITVIKQLRRKRKEFDATRFFVLVVGPVKSGKSTLVNIFARKYVSPTAYEECTALPTIIGKSEGEHLNKIIQYFPTEQFSTDKDQKDTFDYVVDVIREVENHDVLNGRVRKIPTELTNDNVKAILTLYHDKEVDKKELVVSIGIEGGGFIDDEIMLIDMPGLDGGKKHKDNTLVYSNMAKRADVVFFVQSTTSAINKTSIEFLNELFDGKKGKVPVWLIHNVHDSQYFLAEDIKKNKDLQKQIAIGKQRIIDGFEINNFESIPLNLGKIDAVINETDRIKPDNKKEIEKIFAEYEEEEKKIINTLKKERQEIKDTNNIGKAKDEIDDSIKIVDNIINETKSKISVITDNIDKLNKLAGKLDKVQIFDTPFLTEYDNLLVKEHIKNSWETKINSIIADKLPNGGDKIKGEDLKNKIDKLTTECLDAIPVGIGSQFRNQLENSLKSTILEEPLKSAVNKIEQTIKQILQEESVCLVQTISSERLKNKPLKFKEYYSDIKARKWVLDCKAVKYDWRKHNDYLIDLKKHLVGKIDEKLQEYKDVLKADFINIRDKFIENLKSQINRYAEQYENEQEKVIQKLNQEIKLMNDMLNDLKNEYYEEQK